MTKEYMAIERKIEKITSLALMQERALHIRREGKRIGLIPTMGYFHEGHLSLMEEARKETDCVVVSLFVNPIQFGPTEDFEKYPRDRERDIDLAAQAGVDIMFSPPTDEMYPQGYKTFIEVEGLSDILCGASRKGHFKGVATVVCKLFNLVMPAIAYFGQKDAQQVIIIKKMVEDLNLGIRIKVMPTVREKDGLAMSSRNVYLSDTERQAALCLYKAIQKAEELAKKGEREVRILTEEAQTIIRAETLAHPEYIEVRTLNDLSPIEIIDTDALFALAVRIGNTRLIDNTILYYKE